MLQIENITIEGPDLSGKTTLYNNIHKQTNYRWNIQDRSMMSMLAHAIFYDRASDIEKYKRLLEKDLKCLNNVVIVLLPSKELLSHRFNLRGDDIQNLRGVLKLRDIFEQIASNFSTNANVQIIRSEVDDSKVKMLIASLLRYEISTVEQVSHHVKNCVIKPGEIIGQNFELLFEGNDLKTAYNHDDLNYKDEKVYYDKIRDKFTQTIKNELSGKNVYNRIEKEDSRRFIYTDDSCISHIHCNYRKDTLYMNAVLRSSNVGRVLKYDLNFLVSMADIFCDLINVSPRITLLNVQLNSAHII